MCSVGFKTSGELSGKLVAVFSLSKQLLSPQQHYDWGLRAIKTVLSSAGSFLKLNHCLTAWGNTYSHLLILGFIYEPALMTKCLISQRFAWKWTPNTSGNLLQIAKQAGTVTPTMEQEVCVQSLRLNTLSKLTFADSKRFDSLLKDVFPGIDHKVNHTIFLESRKFSGVQNSSYTICSILIILTFIIDRKVGIKNFWGPEMLQEFKILLILPVRFYNSKSSSLS